MFDHVTLRASSLHASTAFYRTVLAAIGIKPTYESAQLVEWDDFSITPAEPGHGPTRHLHVGFVASSRSEVAPLMATGLMTDMMVGLAGGCTVLVQSGARLAVGRLNSDLSGAAIPYHQ